MVFAQYVGVFAGEPRLGSGRARLRAAEAKCYTGTLAYMLQRLALRDEIEEAHTLVVWVAAPRLRHRLAGRLLQL